MTVVAGVSYMGYSQSAGVREAHSQYALLFLILDVFMGSQIPQGELYDGTSTYIYPFPNQNT
jgi:hypothetical protein